MDNYVGRLQELCVKDKYGMPKYVDGEKSGPSHAPTFSCTVTLGQPSTSFYVQETAFGGTKQIAKAVAAQKAYEKITGKINGPATASTSVRRLPAADMIDAMSQHRISSPVPSSSSSVDSKENRPPAPSMFRSSSASETMNEQLKKNSMPTSSSMNSMNSRPPVKGESPLNSLTLLCRENGWTEPVPIYKPYGDIHEFTVKTALITGTYREMKKIVMSANGETMPEALAAACNDVYRTISGSNPLGESNSGSLSPSSCEDKSHVAFTRYIYILNALNADAAKEEKEESRFDELDAVKRLAGIMAFTCRFIPFSEFREQLSEWSSGEHLLTDDSQPFLLTSTLRFADKSQGDVYLHGMGSSELDAQKDCSRNALRYIQIKLERSKA